MKTALVTIWFLMVSSTVFAGDALCKYQIRTAPAENPQSTLFNQQFDVTVGTYRRPSRAKGSVRSSVLEFLLIDRGLKSNSERVYLEDISLLRGKSIQTECSSHLYNSGEIVQAYYTAKLKQTREEAIATLATSFSKGESRDLSKINRVLLDEVMMSFAGGDGLINVNEQLARQRADYRISEVPYESSSGKYWSQTFGVSKCNPQKNLVLVNTATKQIVRGYWIAHCSRGFLEVDATKLSGVDVADLVLPSR